MKYLRAGESEAAFSSERNTAVRVRMPEEGADGLRQVDEEWCQVQEPRDAPMP